MDALRDALVATLLDDDQFLDELATKLGQRLKAANQEHLLDVNEVAARLGDLRPGTVYKMAEDGRLASVKVGGSLRFRPADVDAYIEARQRKPANPGVDRDRIAALAYAARR